MGSTRLPGKVLMRICKKTILELIFERLSKVNRIDRIILVTGPEDKNEELIREASDLGIEYFSGSEENLLDRYYNASKKFDSDNIIRVTADCPLIDFDLINRGLEIFNANYDILCVGRIPSFPHGLDFEIFKSTALSTAWKKTSDRFGDFEKFNSTFICPTEYILSSPDFKKYDLVSDTDMSRIRITLDYKEDFELISKIFGTLYNKKQYFTSSDILEILRNDPSLSLINAKYANNRPMRS